MADFQDCIHGLKMYILLDYFYYKLIVCILSYQSTECSNTFTPPMVPNYKNSNILMFVWEQIN